MILGNELFEFLRYAHDKKVHTTLSTTGFKLDKTKIEEMDNYLDQLQISIRSLNKHDWFTDFGHSNYSNELFNTVINLLQWIKATKINLEVVTVAHKQNINSINELGWQLFSFNPNIIWRVDEYYGIGLHASSRPKYELSDSEFENLKNIISRNFSHLFRKISFLATKKRISPPNFRFIAPNGDIWETVGYEHKFTEYNILDKNFPSSVRFGRSWSPHNLGCRNWGWGDF